MASIEDEVSLLRRIPLFAHIETAKLKLLAFTSERLAYEAGQTLCHQGDAGDAAYVIIDGEADILVETPSGPLKVAHLAKNAIVGEIAILCDMPRTATVSAATPLVGPQDQEGAVPEARDRVPGSLHRDAARIGEPARGDDRGADGGAE